MAGRAKVSYRLFYVFDTKLISPLSISSGESYNTDHDVIVTCDGKPFIPGSSVAGAARAYYRGRNENENDVFGFTSMSDGKMSRIFISDLVFEDHAVSVRDGIRLEEENKVTADKGKFDYQIVEKGAHGELKIEYVIYDDEFDPIKADKIILSLIAGINSGDIRFGFKKNRGLGRLKVNNEYQYRCFKMSSDAEKYIDFCCEPSYEKVKISERPDEYKNDIPSENIIIKTGLVLNGGISIRTYSAVPEAPDFTHLTTGKGKNKKAVIPGSSWNGAIRARTFDILKNEIRCTGLVDDLAQFWGDLGNNKFQASKIYFSESIIENSKPVQMTRNKINRFDASTSDGALYTETAYFGGRAELEIRIKSDELWVVKLVLMAVKDLTNGLLSVGGQTSVGRGIFSEDPENTLKIINTTEKDCTEKLKEKISTYGA